MDLKQNLETPLNGTLKIAHQESRRSQPETELRNERTTAGCRTHSGTPHFANCIQRDVAKAAICAVAVRPQYVPQPGNRNSSVGKGTRYGRDGTGIESRLGVEIFRTCADRLWGPPSLRVFAGGKAVGAWR
jgi:hypothetical protein